jgi:lysophospholipase L1-like esterase
MKILFQGDSITDAGRDKRNYHDLGAGYPKFAAQHIREAFPETDFEFINFGISGNRTCQLFDRLYKDGIEFQPDIISILIGVNDIWHREGSERIATTDQQIETNYRAILTRLKEQTNAKILILTPYLLDCDNKEWIREGLKTVLPIIEKLADEFADAYVPLHTLFDEAMKTQPEPQFYSGDGVHPNANGAEFIGKHYFEAIRPLIEEMV